KDFAKCDCVYSPRQLIEDKMRDYGIDISYRHAHAGYKWVTEAVRGSPDESYQYLVGYSHMLELHNPGTITTIKNRCMEYHKKFHNVTFVEAFMRAAKTYTDDDYRKSMSEARTLPITHLVYFIRSQLMGWFYDRKDLAMKSNHHLSDYARNIIKKVMDEVVNSDQHIVRLKEKSCTCGVFNYEHLPCPHVLVVLQLMKASMYMLCGEYYSRSKWRKYILLR
ncbi:hypothetical protein MKX01_017758, partial [Papaver californicum]